MTNAELAISIELLRELVALDANTGLLTWRKRRPEHFTKTAKRTAEHMAANWNALYEGQSALACVDAAGHLSGRINCRLIFAHRVVFALTHGSWPEREVDHINGLPADNRPGNLRSVSHRDNQRNMRRSSANTSGFTGVSFNARLSKWAAHITVDGSYRHLGFHVEKADAVAARAAASAAFAFHPNHGGSNR